MEQKFRLSYLTAYQTLVLSKLAIQTKTYPKLAVLPTYRLCGMWNMMHGSGILSMSDGADRLSSERTVNGSEYVFCFP